MAAAKKMSYSKSKPLIIGGLSLLATISLTIFLQHKIISRPDDIKIWLESFGAYTILAYIIVQSITIIIAPIGGMGAAIAVLAIFGPLWGNVIIYFVCTPLYIVNFLIARKFGRRVVKKLVGEEGLKTVDNYTNKAGTEVLILLKLMFGGYFDYISYAAGFTNISTKNFVLINFLAGIPGTIIMYLIFRFSPNFTIGVILLFIMPIVTGALYLPFHKKLKKYLQNKNLASREI